jgi:hypothetical protein
MSRYFGEHVGFLEDTWAFWRTFWRTPGSFSRTPWVLEEHLGILENTMGIWRTPRFFEGHLGFLENIWVFLQNT